MSLASELKTVNQIEILLNCVQKVTIYAGRIKDDPKYWEIYFKGSDTPIKIDSELMDSARCFRRQWLKLTDSPAPPLSATDWYMFVSALSEKAEHGVYAEESDNVYIAEALFEQIRELPVIKKETALRAKGYVPQEGYRCVHGYTLKELMEGLNFKLSPRILSSTLTQLGYKEESSKRLWVNGHQNRFWCFKEESFKASGGGLE